MKKIIFLFIGLLSFFLTFSQVNLIQNGNFDISDEYYWGEYCFSGPIFNDYVFIWESQQSYIGKYRRNWQPIKIWQKVPKNSVNCRCASFHSPNYGHQSNIGIVAGIGEYELIQQKFDNSNKLNSNKIYLLTFDFLLPDYVINVGGEANSNLDENDKLVFYISKNKVRYKKTGWIADYKVCFDLPDDDPDFCKCNWVRRPSGYSKYQDGGFQDMIQIGSIQLEDYNMYEKKTIEIYFKSPNNANSYDWFTIDVQSTINTGTNPYVMIDDISLVEVDHCTEPELCSSTDGEISPTIPYQLPNHSSSLFQVNGLDNVFAATNICIYDNLGRCIKTLPDVYSINGIFNPITCDCRLDNGQPFVGSYTWSMMLENDCGEQEYNELFVVTDEINEEAIQTLYNNTINTPMYCCDFQPDIYLNDLILTGGGDLRYTAKRSIYFNNIIVEDNINNLILQASDEIVISGEFVSNNNMTAFIENCTNKNKRNDSVNCLKYVEHDSLQDFNKNHNKVDVFIYPNPTEGFLSIKSLMNDNKIISMQLFDLLGKEICRNNFNNQVITFDLTNIQNGIYFCVLKTQQGVVSKKIVKI